MSRLSQAAKQRKHVKALGREWTPWISVAVTDRLKASNPYLEHCYAIYTNSRFEVQMFNCSTSIGGVMQMVVNRHLHLEPITWHELLRIKNELFSVNALAVEVYPREIVGPDFKIRVLWILPEGTDLPYGLDKPNAWGRNG